jgi:hypothetical protein
MTPEESQLLDEQRRKRIEALRSFKDTNGYKILMEIVRDQFTACVRAQLDPECEFRLEQIQSDMIAWNSIGQLIDFEIQSYDHMAYTKLQQQQGGYNG